MSIHLAKREHEVAYQELCQFLSRHSEKLTKLEMLAVAANMVGKLIALQDQREVTPTTAMDIVAKNIEYGNKEVLEQLQQSKGKA